MIRDVDAIALYPGQASDMIAVGQMGLVLAGSPAIVLGDGKTDHVRSLKKP